MARNKCGHDEDFETSTRLRGPKTTKVRQSALHRHSVTSPQVHVGPMALTGIEHALRIIMNISPRAEGLATLEARGSDSQAMTLSMSCFPPSLGFPSFIMLRAVFPAPFGCLPFVLTSISYGRGNTRCRRFPAHPARLGRVGYALQPAVDGNRPSSVACQLVITREVGRLGGEGIGYRRIGRREMIVGLADARCRFTLDLLLSRSPSTSSWLKQRSARLR